MPSTQVYATSLGNGLHDGTDWANAWTYEESRANVANDSIVNFSEDGGGAHQPAAGGMGNFAQRVTWIGWKDDLSGYALSRADYPRIDLSLIGVTSAISTVGLYERSVFINFMNAPGTVFQSTALDNTAILFCQFTDCANICVYLDQYVHTAFCYFDGCGAALVTTLVQCDRGSAYLWNEFVDCLGLRALNSLSGGVTIMGNSQMNSSFSLADVTTRDGDLVAMNTLNGAVASALDPTTSLSVSSVLNILTNAGVGFNVGAAATNMISLFDNMYGNTTDYANPADVTGGATTLDPLYVNAAGGLPDIGEAGLIDRILAIVNTEVNAGSWQGKLGGGGLAFRPRQRIHGA